jgi:hypothetical protein
MDGTEKVREARLRRMAQRQGFQLVKSRRRDPLAVDFGGYVIVDPASGQVVAGELDSPRALMLDEVENWLGRSPVEVILESESADADRLAVAEVFESAGIRADVQGAYIRRSADILPWLIEIVAAGAVTKFLWAAAAGAGDEAGRDAWQGLKRLITSLHEARKASRAPQGGVTIRDPESGVVIQLGSDLPDEAYRLLYEIETFSAPLSGILRWDSKAQDWKDVFAGEYRCMYPGCLADATQSRVHRPSPKVMLSRLLCDDHAAAVDSGDPTPWE